MTSPSVLKKQGSSLTIVSPYVASSSTSDIVVPASEVHRPRKKPEDIDHPLRPSLTVTRKSYFPQNPASRATANKGRREHITANPVVPAKTEDAKDVTIAMPLLPNKEDNVEEIDVPKTSTVLSRLANLCTRLWR